MSNTSIEWTEKTWNPVTGCSKVSQGCKNCYAERIFQRPYPGRAFTDVRVHEDRLEAPLHWRKPSRIFVNSMSDLFHEKVPFEFIDRVFAVMALAKEHTFQVLTKRPERMLEYFASMRKPEASSRGFNTCDWAACDLMGRGLTHEEIEAICIVALGLPNVWLGVSVEDQKSADERIPLLLQTPAAVRWISYEPALGPVDFSCGLRVAWQCSSCRGYFAGGLQKACPTCGKEDYWSGSHIFNPPGRQVGSGLQWIVCGGESGPGARPMHPDWARSARDQCQAGGVPYFFKQWGEFSVIPKYRDGVGWRPVDVPAGDGTHHRMFRVGKHAAGRLLDGREWNEYPQAADRQAVPA